MDDTADADNGDSCHSEKKDTAGTTEVAGDNSLRLTNLLNPEDDGRHRKWIQQPGKSYVCDFCNKRSKGMLQRCSQCSMQICEACVKTGRLQNSFSHIIDPKEVNWEREAPPKKTKASRASTQAEHNHPTSAVPGHVGSAQGNDGDGSSGLGPETKVRFANQVTSGDDEPLVRKRARHTMSPPLDTGPRTICREVEGNSSASLSNTQPAPSSWRPAPHVGTLTAASGRTAVRASAAMAVHRMSKPAQRYWERANSPDEVEKDDDQNYHGGRPSGASGSRPQDHPHQLGGSQPGGHPGIPPPDPRQHVGFQPGIPPNAQQPAGYQQGAHPGIPPPNARQHAGYQPGAPPGPAPPNINAPNPVTRPQRKQAPSRLGSAASGIYMGPFSSRSREIQVTGLYREIFGGDRYYPLALTLTDLPTRADEPAIMAQDPRGPPRPVFAPPSRAQGQPDHQQPLPEHVQHNHQRLLPEQVQHHHQQPRSAHGPQDYQRPHSAQNQQHHQHPLPEQAQHNLNYQRPHSAQGQPNPLRPLSENDQHHREVQTYMMTGGHFDPTRKLPPHPPSYADNAFHNYPNQNQYAASVRPTPAYHPTNELHPEQIRLMHEDRDLLDKISHAWVNNGTVLRVRQLGLKAFRMRNVTGRGAGPEDYTALKLLWEVALMRMARVVLPTAPQTTRWFVEALQRGFFELERGGGDGLGELEYGDEEGGEASGSGYDDRRDGDYNPRMG